MNRILLRRASLAEPTKFSPRPKHKILHCSPCPSCLECSAEPGNTAAILQPELEAEHAAADFCPMRRRNSQETELTRERTVCTAVITQNWKVLQKSSPQTPHQTKTASTCALWLLIFSFYTKSYFWTLL